MAAVAKPKKKVEPNHATDAIYSQSIFYTYVQSLDQTGTVLIPTTNKKENFLLSLCLAIQIRALLIARFVVFGKKRWLVVFPMKLRSPQLTTNSPILIMVSAWLFIDHLF